MNNEKKMICVKVVSNDVPRVKEIGVHSKDLFRYIFINQCMVLNYIIYVLIISPDTNTL